MQPTIQDVIVETCSAAATGIGLNSLDRAKFVVAVTEALVAAVAPFMAPAPKAPAGVIKRKPRGPNKPKATAAAAPATVGTITDVPVPPAPVPPTPAAVGMPFGS